MSTPSGHKIKIQGMYRRVAVTADSSGGLPTRIELMRSGEWPASSMKGPLVETVASLNEYKRNYDAGISQSQDSEGNYIGLPIDFMHEDWDMAAAWIKGMEVAPSSTPDLPADEGGMALWATPVEWTTAGTDAVKGGMFKCFSPSWWPASLGDWTDPEDPNITARNVIVGGGLTNIPFFKGLTSLTASTASNKDGKINQENVIYINADERNTMTLDEIRVKEAASLTDEEKAFVAEHKSDLSQDELTKFDLVETPTAGEEGQEDEDKNEEVPVTDEAKEALALQASIKKGEKVVMEASEVQTLKASVEAHAKQLAEYRRKEVEASVKAHVARGAIKADQSQAWTDRIIADTSVEDLLKDLPSNKIVASELGSEEAAEGDDRDRQVTLAKAKMVASQGKMGIQEAMQLAAAEIKAA